MAGEAGGVQLTQAGLGAIRGALEGKEGEVHQL